MLNVISRSIVSKHTRGPRKVVLNLLKGLDEIKYPYVVNAALDATKVLWIHDDPQALKEAMKLPKSVAIIAGPNVYTLPSEIPSTIDTKRIIWIHPALWVQKFWEQSLGTPLQSVVWPVGIDTEAFSPTVNSSKDLILVYNKQRSNEEVKLVCQALEARNEKYEVITYGNYHESNYRSLLERSKALIWIGRSESQGIGFLEALAMNVPALVWDIEQFGQWSGSGQDRFTQEQLAFKSATAVPYFDSTCGMLFSKQTELDSSLAQFLANLSKFAPRKYVENNLSLTKQAVDFINIYKSYFNINDEILRDTTLTNNKKWKNASWGYYLNTQIKDAIRSIIR
jgi:glycosyltransferase involved in cell wall biosynthesis